MAFLSTDRLALLRAVLAGKGLLAPKASDIRPRAERERAPLSAAQERLFFLELYEPGTALHNDAVAVHVEGELDPACLRRALEDLQARHEILRTSLALEAGGPVQRIHPALPLPLAELDFCAVPDARARARERAVLDARTPFDLERAPLWRATLARVALGEWLFVLTMHHIVSDGASMGLFFDELAERHDAHRSGVRPGLAPLALQFGDYAAWERAGRDEAREAAQLAYWKQELAGELTNLAWPSAPGLATRRGELVSLCFAGDAGARLARLARAERVTSNQVLLAAHLAFLGATTGATDVRTGLASSLRQRPELETLLGFFVQSLVVRADLGGDPTFLEILRRVRTTTLAALQHGALPYDRVARAVERRGGPPLLQTYFSHMQDAIRAPAFAGTRTSWEFVDAGIARFELALVLHESAAELRGFCEVDRGVFDARAARALARGYTDLLEQVLTTPGLRLSELSRPAAASARPARRQATLSCPPRRRGAAGE